MSTFQEKQQLQAYHWVFQQIFRTLIAVTVMTPLNSPCMEDTQCPLSKPFCLLWHVASASVLHFH